MFPPERIIAVTSFGPMGRRPPSTAASGTAAAPSASVFSCSRSRCTASAIGSKLHEAGSPYAAIFDALQAIAGGTPAEVIEIPADNADLEALDREWEEEEVSFLGAGVGGCSPARPATAARRS